MRNQTARICWNGVGGNDFHLDKGVRQGGILSPFLFKLYINGILNRISNTNIGCRFGFLKVNILAYADDVVLIADSESNLEILYTIFSSGIQDLKLTINKIKSKCMIVERPTKRNQRSELKLGNDNLGVIDNYKYLGHIVESQLVDYLVIKQRLQDFN